MSQDAQIFEDTFVINTINSEKYDRVSRLFGKSTDNSLELELDINIELFNVSPGDSINVVLATTLNLDGTKDDKAWRENSKEPNLADHYEYVCYGKNYRFEDGPDEIMYVGWIAMSGDPTNYTCRKFYASFGGLLLFIKGPYKKMSSLKIENVYMLVKKA